ncbi:MAG: cell division topological specificity factor MinE [Deltaproteobacteria bacterium]|nr:cell division topological specificity factor MinE [Deltaproteobacteria bacterium]MCX7952932.1 cell division topological specificity factor MinE [Deltaproteobacteria bacterium]
MLNLFKRFFGTQTKRSSSNVIAKNRLTVVLIQDRAGLTSRELEQFRTELIRVIEKYFVIDVSGFDIDYKRQSDCTILSISSPVLVKRLVDHAERENLSINPDSDDQTQDNSSVGISLEAEVIRNVEDSEVQNKRDT